jgi:hypothetical protein
MANDRGQNVMSKLRMLFLGNLNRITSFKSAINTVICKQVVNHAYYITRAAYEMLSHYFLHLEISMKFIL